MENKEKKLSEQLFYDRKSAYDLMDEKEVGACYDFCEGYMDFLTNAKTERACVNYAVELAQSDGFQKFDEHKLLKAGDKFYKVHRNKAVILGVIGQDYISEGVNIVMAPI